MSNCVLQFILGDKELSFRANAWWDGMSNHLSFSRPLRALYTWSGD